MEQLGRLAQFPTDNFDVTMALAIAAGTLYCFLGYRVFRFILFLTGFILAGSVAAGGANLLSEGHTTVSIVAGLVGGIAGAMAMLFAYKAGVFCVGALGGMVVALHLLTPGQQDWAFWAVIGTGIAAGLVALVLERFIMSLATAAIGAWALVSGLAYFILNRNYVPSPEEPVPSGDDRLMFLAAWLTLALLGAFFQLTTLRKRERVQPSAMRL